MPPNRQEGRRARRARAYARSAGLGGSGRAPQICCFHLPKGTAMTTVDFARRSSATELMDSPSIGFDEFHQCLRQLTIVNGCVLAYRPTLRWLKAMLRDAPADKTISILDVGSGGGDMLRKIRQLTRQRGIN